MNFWDSLKHIGFSSYADYLKSEHWKEFKNAYRKCTRMQVCAVCRAPWVELHHRRYKNLGREEFKDVIPLCRLHHQAVHDWLKATGKSLVNTQKAIDAIKVAFGTRSPGKQRILGNKKRFRPAVTILGTVVKK